MTPFEQTTGCKPDLKRVLEFGAIMWVRVKDAGKLDLQAVEGHFVDYDEKLKEYHVFFSKCRSVIVEPNVYFNKGAVVDVGEVVFKEETEGKANTNFSNPTVPINSPESALKAHDAGASSDTTEIPPISIHNTPQSPIPIKPCHNSLAGLPQFDPLQYGHGKSRHPMDKVKTALIVEGHDGFKASRVEFEDPMEAEFLHKAMLAVSKDQPPIKSAINRPESDQ